MNKRTYNQISGEVLPHKFQEDENSNLKSTKKIVKKSCNKPIMGSSWTNQVANGFLHTCYTQSKLIGGGRFSFKPLKFPSSPY